MLTNRTIKYQKYFLSSFSKITFIKRSTRKNIIFIMKHNFVLEIRHSRFCFKPLKIKLNPEITHNKHYKTEKLKFVEKCGLLFKTSIFFKQTNKKDDMKMFSPWHSIKHLHRKNKIISVIIQVRNIVFPRIATSFSSNNILQRVILGILRMCLVKFMNN